MVVSLCLLRVLCVHEALYYIMLYNITGNIYIYMYMIKGQLLYRDKNATPRAPSSTTT